MSLQLRDIVSEVFACLGPLRACEGAVQNNIIAPIEEYVIDPVRENCIDPVQRALEVNPFGCVPFCNCNPTLPQYDTPAQQQARADQIARTQPHYQYNYNLMRTFKVVDLGQQGQHPDCVVVSYSKNGIQVPPQEAEQVNLQCEGVAILDSLPLSQLPALLWLLDVMRHALVILDNFMLVLELIGQQRRRVRRGVEGEQEDEPDLTAVTFNEATQEEIEQTRQEVQQLRAEIYSSFLGVRRLINRETAANADRELVRPLEPASELNTSQPVTCTCSNCSPVNFAREMYTDISNGIQQLVKKILMLPAIDRQPLSIKAYNDLFQSIPLPTFALDFQSDEMFALQRVAGQNPVVLHRVEWTDELSARFPVSPAEYKSVMGLDDSLEDAGNEGRLYLCDYRESLENNVSGNFPDLDHPPPGFSWQKHLNVPLVLLALKKSDRNVLKAVAIQINQEPGPTNPVFTPEDGWNWEIAKTCVQNADCNDSEYYRHLGLAHVLTEAFILATYRQLPTSHPLYVLLTPNFQGTFFTNNLAITSINDAGSYLNITEMIFSGTVPSTLGIAANAVHDVNYTENFVPNDLKKRGVDDPNLLPNYPYRDDAMLIWNTIRNWAGNYVRIYYTTDEDVIGDYELQNWVLEVSSQHGGRIQGVGVNNRIETVDYLIDCMTSVIFTASAHHALTNFPLHEYEIYSPGWPGAIYRPAPTSKDEATREDWMRYLAPLNMAILQQALGFTVGGIYFTQLGQYHICHFNDPRVRGPLAVFQQELARAEEVIRDRNMNRPLPYPFLLPSQIPASTNI
jgi:arachidonate 15-lipoxygenase